MFSTRDVVRAMFINTFDTEPTDQQYAEIGAEIGDDPVALAELADRLRRFADGLRSLAQGSLPDHSQHGEFRMLLRHLVRDGSVHGIIVDVGAHGRRLSNSYDLLAGFGWHGLLIEANPALLPGIRDEFAGTDFELVGCAVGVEIGRMPFHLGPNPAVSSLNASHAALFGETKGTIEVDVRRLSDILDASRIPHDFDVLSLDIESLDVPVFNDLIATSSYRPRRVLIETEHAFTARTPEDFGVEGPAATGYVIVDRIACNLLLSPNGHS